MALDESVDGQPFIARFSPLCWVVLVLICPVVFAELSFRSVSQTRHLLDAILHLSVCLLFVVGSGGVRFPGEVGVLVNPRLR